MSVVKLLMGGIASLAMVALVGCTRCSEQPQETPAPDFMDEAHSGMDEMDTYPDMDMDMDMDDLDIDDMDMDDMDMGYDEEDVD